MFRVSLQAAVCLKVRLGVEGTVNMEQAHRWCGDRQKSSALRLTPSRVHAGSVAQADHTRNAPRYREIVRPSL